MNRITRIAEFVRANRVGVGAGLVLATLTGIGVRWIAATSRERPSPRKAMQYTVVNLQPPPRPSPPPQVTPPKVEDEPQSKRVDLDPAQVMPDAPRPESSEPAPGPLALAAAGEGPGDAFNLAGNPGGRGLLTGGGLGDGSGAGLGSGGTGNRFGWYYAKVAADLEEAFRRHKRMSAASARVELRVWTDTAGRISRVQLIRSTGDIELDAAIQSVVGLKLREAPPRDIPMPMIARLTARRPE
jgi:outer membrane biosynthesis protein TonB